MHEMPCLQSEGTQGVTGSKKTTTLPYSVSVSEASTDDDDQQIRPTDSSELDSPSWFHILLSLSDTPVSVSATRLLDRVVRMLRTCKYAEEDITAIFAVSASHHRARILKRMNWELAVDQDEINSYIHALRSQTTQSP